MMAQSDIIKNKSGYNTISIAAENAKAAFTILFKSVFSNSFVINLRIKE
jgi:hypothetical protein